MAEDRLKSLDGLRAFAILAVMLYHTESHFKKITLRIYDVSFENIIYNGFYGVDLFFVLSGFLITTQLLHRPLTRPNIKTFFLRRFFRIAPAYYTILFFIVFYVYIPQDPEQSPNIWFLPLFSHIIFLQDYLFSTPRIAAVFWSIPIEMKFYALMPLALYFLMKIRNKSYQAWCVFLFFILYTTIKTLILLNMNDAQSIEFIKYCEVIKFKFHFTLDSLIVGVLCAYINKSSLIVTFLKNKNNADLLLVTGFLALFFLCLPDQFYITGKTVSLFTQTLVPFILALIFGVITISSIHAKKFGYILSSRPLKAIATLSYSAYLIHILILSNIQNIAESYPSELSWTSLTLIYLITTFTFSYLMYITIEQPMIEWSKKRFQFSKLTNAEKNI